MDNPHALECILDGFDGPKEALAIPPKNGVVWDVKASDGTISIMVGSVVVNRKFASDDKPTFYYS